MSASNLKQTRGQAPSIASDEVSGHAERWISLAKGRLAAVGVPSEGSRTPVSHDVIRDRIEREVQGALLAISTLRYQQNLLSPINRLPQELLSQIFHELSLSVPLYGYNILGSWAGVTYVCHTWRSTALDTASLWTSIPLQLGQRWAQAFVYRSRAAPLHLAGTRTEVVKPSWRFDLLSELFSRFASLDLAGPHSVNTINELLTSLEPRQLRKLIVEVSSQYNDTDALVSLLGAQRLQDVTLERVPLTWDALPWGGLRRLVIIKPAWSPTVINLPALITSLRSTTVLEDLQLDLSYPMDNTVMTDATVVQLPYLRTFAMTAYAADCQAFFNAVHIVPTASLRISLAEDGRAGILELSIINPLLRAHSDIDASRPHIDLQTMKINVERYTGRLRVRVWPYDIEHPDNTLSPPDAFIDITLPPKTAFSPDLLNICTSINVTSLRRVHVDFSYIVIADADSLWKKRAWYEVFASAKSVRALHFRGTCAHKLLEALSMPLSTFPPSVPTDALTAASVFQGANTRPQKLPPPPSSAMLFPALRELCLAGVGCNTVDHHLNDNLIPSITRRQKFTKLEKLDIEQCEIDEDIPVQLEAMGLEVEWDHLTGYTEDEDEEECEYCEGEGCEECMDDYDEEDYY